jgi:hypothetical protein
MQNNGNELTFGYAQKVVAGSLYLHIKFENLDEAVMVEVRARQWPDLSSASMSSLHTVRCTPVRTVITNSPLVARPSSDRLRRCPLALA